VSPDAFPWPIARSSSSSVTIDLTTVDAANQPAAGSCGEGDPLLAHLQHDADFNQAAPPLAGLAALQHAAALIRQGQVVAMPTETVYGLAGNALDAGAVAAIYAAKDRPADNPLIVHISSLDMLQRMYPPGWRLPDVYRRVVAAHWPGPLTILLPRSHQASRTYRWVLGLH
jgi:tRNA A37 threonylcarbamoyladenosine synthetase subunit TsaC/SUA5/YrdC